MSLPITPSQTVGPFLALGLPWPDGPFVVPEGTPGAITITGVVLDGAGDPVPDALVETWQADAESGFDHPDDPRGAVPSSTPGFRGFGRSATDQDGGYRIVTIKPGPLPCPAGGPGGSSPPNSTAGGPGGSSPLNSTAGRTEAPHLDVSVFARGLLDRVVTRIYFADEAEANAADPVLSAIAEPDRRETLLAVPGAGPGEFRFDIRLRGDGETVFFDV